MQETKLELKSIEKQIMLYSKCWYNEYLIKNNINITTIDILRRMVSKYCRCDIKHADVYFWVKNLYCKLANTGKFPHLRADELLKITTDTLCLPSTGYFPATEVNRATLERQYIYLIERLLGDISMTEAKELDDLGIDMGKPDYSFITDYYSEEEGLGKYNRKEIKSL